VLYTVSMRLLLFAFINTKIENNWFSKYLQDTHLLGFRRRLFIQLRSLCFPSDLSPCVGQYGGSPQFFPVPRAPSTCPYGLYLPLPRTAKIPWWRRQQFVLAKGWNQSVGRFGRSVFDFGFKCHGKLQTMRPDFLSYAGTRRPEMW